MVSGSKGQQLSTSGIRAGVLPLELQAQVAEQLLACWAGSQSPLQPGQVLPGGSWALLHEAEEFQERAGTG